MTEFDILRDRSQDLTADGVWQQIWSKLQAGVFDFVIMAPPCNTFSRARHNRQHLGPKPLRLLEYPRGFPWLKSTDAQKVEIANLLVDRSLQIALECCKRGIGFLLEHPEQLGIAAGMIPASIWNFKEFLMLEEFDCLRQAAIFQCQFGAPTSKPTRLATSAVQAFEQSPFATLLGKHQLDATGAYLGPLPRQCPHGTHQQKLIGKSQTGEWNTAPSAAYPSEMCKQIALMIQHHLLRRSGGVRHRQCEEGGQRKLDLAKDGDQLLEEGKDELDPFHGELKQAALDNAGLPMVCRWQNKVKSFTDGGGLNSPGRWSPECRGTNLDRDKVIFIDKLAILVRKFVISQLTDLKRETFKLATGNMTEPPFDESALWKLREEWFSLLGGHPLLKERTQYQPFFLFALSETLKRMGDEDTEVLTQTPGDNYVTGRRVGVGKPIDPAPLVFRPRRKMKKYDDSEFRPLAENYPSAEESKEIILKQFQEEEQLGWMYPLSEGEARRRFGQRLRVASLAAIPKDEHTVRVLFDGTHSVQVNNEVTITDRLEFPCPSELAHVMEHCQLESYGVVIGIAADIMKAHRRFLHCPEDHGLLGCRADSSSETIWINRVGTFGVACAALHFGRLAGAIFRMVIRVLKQQPCFQLLFADDLKLVVSGATKYLDLWSMIVVWLLVGTPFSWKKFRGGLELDYVGFWTDYARFQIGLNEKRAAWVIKTVESLATSQYVMNGRAFSELLGRLGYAALAVPWLRPLLGPLYAWDGVLTPFMAARVPALAALTLELIATRFRLGDFTSVCWSPTPLAGDCFRTDAKCETGRIVLGGWEVGDPPVCKQARWFACEILPADAPWLFYKGLDVQKLSTTAELLASYAALHAFEYVTATSDERKVRALSMVAAGTDNLANEMLARKRLTTKLPLGLLMLQFHLKAWDNSLWIDIRWRPRGENVEADRLTNLDFSDFCEANRIEFSYSQMDFRLLDTLQTHLASFEESTARPEGGIPIRKGLSKRLKVETRSNW